MKVNNLNTNTLFGVIIVSRLAVCCEVINTHVVASVVKLLYDLEGSLRINVRLKFCYNIKITF